ncbi:MAG: TonB-dependent receptor [Pseudomonadota bacterium]
MNPLSVFALAALVATSSLSTPANAQDDTVDLGTVVLSGGLTPVAANAYGRASTIITAQEIIDRGITTVQDALRAVPGVSVNGSGGNFTQVRIRGGEGNHTLILIDGVEAAGGDGEYILSGLETANIERIEVLRGPQSVFYGSNASAGVINIITRKGGIGDEFRATFEAGDGTTLTGFASKRNEKGGVSFNFSRARDDGWDFSDDGGEEDKTDRQTMIIKADYQILPALELGFSFRDATEDFDFDSNSFTATNADEYVVDSDAFATRDEQTFNLYAEVSPLNGRLTHRLSIEQTENERTDNGGAPTETSTDAIKYLMSIGLDEEPVAAADQLLNVLIEKERDSSSSNPDFERNTDSIALEYRGGFESGLDLQAGVRLDRNDPFEAASTWTLGVSHTLDNGVRLHASKGTGIVNPSYFELYADAFGFVGNPDLEPERNESTDLGVEVPFLDGRGYVDITIFDETLTDEISSVSLTAGGFTYENQTGDSTREGVEVSGQLAVTDDLDLRASYTYLEAENPDGSAEIRRAEREFAFGATLRAFDDKATFAANLRRISSLPDTQFFGSFETVELPSITTLDVSARYALNNTVSLTSRVVNLTDEDTMEVWGYAGRPRQAYVGIDARY